MKNFLFNSLVLILLVPITASFLREMGRQSSPTTHQIIEYINSDLPENSVILTLRQADFAFKSKRKFIADFDERLLPLFETKNENQFYIGLKKLGVTHVFTPAYTHPIVYNSFLQDILSNPQYSQIVLSQKGATLFELKGLFPENTSYKLFELSFNDNSEPGRLHAKELGEKAVLSDGFLILKSQRWRQNTSGGQANYISVQPSTIYTIDIKTKGQGLVEIMAKEFNLEKKSTQMKRFVGGFVLSNEPRNARYRFETGPSTYGIKLSLELRGYQSEHFIALRRIALFGPKPQNDALSLSRLQVQVPNFSDYLSSESLEMGRNSFSTLGQHQKTTLFPSKRSPLAYRLLSKKQLLSNKLSALVSKNMNNPIPDSIYILRADMHGQGRIRFGIIGIEKTGKVYYAPRRTERLKSSTNTKFYIPFKAPAGLQKIEPIFFIDGEISVKNLEILTED